MDNFCIFFLAFMSDNRKIALDEVAALGYILGSLHLIASQHPHLYVCPDEIADGLWDLIL